MNLQDNSQLNTSKATTLHIDWISTTCKQIRENLAYASFPLLHDWDNWETTNGIHGYTIGAKHTTGVKTYTNLSRPDMGMHTVYSGLALKRIEEMNGDNGIDVLKYHIGEGHTIARLDIALDFINHGTSVLEFQQAFELGKVNTRIKSASVVQSLTHAGHTLYLGSRAKRKKLIRVYDKAAEQGIDGDWVRVELQLMGKPATQAGIELSRTDDLIETMLGIMRGVADFTTINCWNQAMQDVSSVRIGSQSSEKGDTRKWLYNQCVPAIIRETRLDATFWTQFQLFINGVLGSD